MSLNLHANTVNLIKEAEQTLAFPGRPSELTNLRETLEGRKVIVITNKEEVERNIRDLTDQIKQITEEFLPSLRKNPQGSREFIRQKTNLETEKRERESQLPNHDRLIRKIDDLITKAEAKIAEQQGAPKPMCSKTAKYIATAATILCVVGAVGAFYAKAATGT